MTRKPIALAVAGVILAVGLNNLPWRATEMSEVEAANPNAKGRDGLPIIFQTIDSRNISAVRELLDAGADIESKGFGGATPVLQAALVSTWEICLLLLERGADPIVANHVGLTVPYLAAESRVAPGTSEHDALMKVLRLLETRSLSRLALPPKEVRALVAAGRWPPG